MSTAEPVSDKKAADKLKLWFFRDISRGHRQSLYSIFGMPVAEIRTHGDESHVFKHILSALSHVPPEPVSVTVTAYVCTGCGRPCRDPDADFETLREAGKLSCCPERNMKPVFFAALSHVQAPAEPITYQRRFPNSEWDWIECRKEDIAHYQGMGQEVRPLYAAPQTPHVQAPAEPHPLAAFPDGIRPGLYIIHWKSGGTSEAAIGMLENGNRWIAPTNWAAPGLYPDADEWAAIDHVERISTHVDEAMVERGAIAGNVTDEKAREIIEAAIGGAKP